MKILHLLNDLNIYGGTPKKIFDLSKKSENEHFIYTWHKVLGEKETNDIVKLFSNAGCLVFENYIGKSTIKHLITLKSHVLKHDIDVIHCYFYYGELLGAFFKFFFNRKVKVVVSFVGSNNPNGFKKHLLSVCYRMIDQFVFNSNYTFNAKVSNFSYLNRTNNIIIYNGVELIKKPAIKYNGGENSIKMISVGGLTKIKNHIVLLRAMKLLRDFTSKTLILEIYGDGQYFEFLNKYIIENNLENIVKLKGYSAEIENELINFDFYLHPCYAEGFGISVIEAMYSGKMVMCANNGALPELLKNKSGLLLDKDDHEIWAKTILELSTNSNIVLEYMKNARLRVEKKFNLKRFVDLHDNKVYKS